MLLGGRNLAAQPQSQFPHEGRIARPAAADHQLPRPLGQMGQQPRHAGGGEGGEGGGCILK